MAEGFSEPELTLNDLLDSANDAAVDSRNVITAMLGTAVTLAATILASSDEAILRDSLSAPFGMPVNITLSVAYALMPPVFLYLHINALLQLHVLMERIALFERRLRSVVPIRRQRDNWRRRLHGFAFVQYLTDDEHPGTPHNQTLEYFRNLLLWIVVQISAVCVPLIILVSTQVSFLRYQSDGITLFHRAFVIIDLIFILWFQFSQEIKMREDKNIRRPAELPIGGLAHCVVLAGILWFCGVEISVIMAVLNGVVWGWLIRRVADPSSSQIKIWLLAICVSVLVWWTIDATISDGVGFLFGFLPFLVLHVADLRRERLKQPTPTNWIRTFMLRSGNSSLTGLMSTLIILSTLLVWFSMTQAVVPTGEEPACQIRWDNDFARRYINLKNPPGTFEADASKDSPIKTVLTSASSTVSRVKANVLTRFANLWKIVLLPAFGWEERYCFKEADSTGWQKIIEQDRSQSVARANVLDRWTCSLWSIGCRYISLPYTILLAKDESSEAFKKINMSKSDLEESTLRALGINLRDRKLRFADLRTSRMYGADLRNADLRGADLSKSNLQGALISDALLKKAKFNQAFLYRADLSNSFLQETSLVAANFVGADLWGAQLQGADLSATDLEMAEMSFVDLRGALLRATQLQGAILRQSKVAGAWLDSADMRGSVSPGDFTGAIITNSNFDGATGGTAMCSGGLWLDTSMKPWPQASRRSYLKDSFGKPPVSSEMSSEMEEDALESFENEAEFHCDEARLDKAGRSRFSHSPDQEVWATVAFQLTCSDPAAFAGLNRNLASQTGANPPIRTAYAQKLTELGSEGTACRLPSDGSDL